MADDEIADAGPLALRVGEDVASAATGLHTQWGQPLIYVLLSLHVAAIVWYRLRRVDLVRPMVTGDKWLPSAVPESRDTVWTRLLARGHLLGGGSLDQRPGGLRHTWTRLR